MTDEPRYVIGGKVITIQSDPALFIAMGQRYNDGADDALRSVQGMIKAGFTIDEISRYIELQLNLG